MLNLFNPFGLFESAIRGAAGGIAKDLEPDHDAPAAPPPAPVAAPAPPPPAPPAPRPRIRLRPLQLHKPAHSTAFYVAAGGVAAAAVVGVGYLALRGRG